MIATQDRSPAHHDLLERATTALFVPGDRPERYASAVASAADLVVVDLEDAVAPDAKDVARLGCLAALSTGRLSAVVRVNALDSAPGRADVEALAALVAERGHGLIGVMVPKAYQVEALDDLGRRLGAGGGVGIVALVESAGGVLAAADLAAAASVVRLAVGAQDLALDLGVPDVGAALEVACVQVVLASRAAGIAAPLASPPMEVRDLDAVSTAARRARDLGFGGQLCIHPAQVPAVLAGLAPEPAEVAWALAVGAAGAATTTIEGRMVDRPVLERARAVLRRAPRPDGPPRAPASSP